MAKVDVETMRQMLDDLQQLGVIMSYERRLLGMWVLVLGNGTVLRPDTKETAMWVMGAMAGVAATAERMTPTVQAQSVAPTFTRAEVEAALNNSANVEKWHRVEAYFRVTFRPVVLVSRQVMAALEAIDKK
ncbi:hypothetical protein [Jiangella alkaliphila]|uniref:Uncharacterized protein n=1 Tax=Jiangella alkaliphila TaxID=419479 RepID=A0A1H2LDX4_9ACTN|nr:hypothetical protein [Jiangella alkaliphila]SDU78935.1 hypothetical protein SAMN04488563_5895 [Jiangella alkaliphila]